MVSQDVYHQPKMGSPQPGQPQFASPPSARAQKQSERLRTAAAPLLPPGTTIRQCFEAETRSPWLFIAMALPLALIGAALVFIAINRNRVIAVTDNGIYVLDCGAFGGKKPKRVLAVLPRSTRFGPLNGVFPKVRIGNETLFIAQMFAPEVAAADYQAAYVSSTGQIDLTAPAPPAMPAAPVVYGGKSKTTAGVLGILLGMFGAHKFYLGQTGIGIAYLLFCWTFIPGLLGFVEGILMLVKSDDEFQRRYGNPELARQHPLF